MITEGYDRPKNRIVELTKLLDGNQILIEHRFFGQSLPDTLDYKYLTLKQVTGDLHHINELFKRIYKNNESCRKGRTEFYAGTLAVNKN